MALRNPGNTASQAPNFSLEPSDDALMRFKNRLAEIEEAEKPVPGFDFPVGRTALTAELATDDTIVCDVPS